MDTLGYGFNISKNKKCLFPQIAIAIGVLTSNRGGGRRTTLADWTWHQGAIAGCRGRGAIAGCHCSVVWLGGRVTTNFGGVGVVPLQGAHGTADYTVLYIANAKIIFCYLGSMLVQFGPFDYGHASLLHIMFMGTKRMVFYLPPTTDMSLEQNTRKLGLKCFIRIF